MNDIDNKRFDKIVELGRGNEDRTLDFITGGASTAERQQALVRRRKAEGQQRVTVWASLADLDALRASYPGQRGGIDWQAIINKALGRKAERLAANKSKPEDAPQVESEQITDSPQPENLLQRAYRIKQEREAAWYSGAHTFDVLGIDRAEWEGCRTNAKRKAMAKAAYRRLAMRHHPDRGGDADAMARYSVVYSAFENGNRMPSMPDKWMPPHE
jgi:hypothetical protein